MSFILRQLLALVARLPLSWLHAAGAALGWAMYGISPTYRRRVNENLRQAGLVDPRVRREAIASAGQMLAELPALWFRPQAAVAALVREVEGAQPVYDARSRGEALLFLTPHLGCFEVTAQYASREVPITVLYRPPKLAWLEPLMQAGRSRGAMRLAPADVTGVRELFGALKRAEAVGFLPDQVPGQGEGEWAEFFGRPAYTMTLAAKLAERPGLACFLAYARRLPRGEGFSIHVRPYPAREPGESPVRHLNRALESLVRECPGQYLWSYNRYKKPRHAKPPAGPAAP